MFKLRVSFNMLNANAEEEIIVYTGIINIILFINYLIVFLLFPKHHLHVLSKEGYYMKTCFIFSEMSSSQCSHGSR